uniref:Uncharacterized protein n=1 Tax=Anguilla anguilla TaxID=7936 RepID=A0A0E9T266_ANGAN
MCVTSTRGSRKAGTRIYFLLIFHFVT